VTPLTRSTATAMTCETVSPPPIPPGIRIFSVLTRYVKVERGFTYLVPMEKLRVTVPVSVGGLTKRIFTSCERGGAYGVLPVRHIPPELLWIRPRCGAYTIIIAAARTLFYYDVSSRLSVCLCRWCTTLRGDRESGYVPKT
jgi:hypothetical protein